MNIGADFLSPTRCLLSGKKLVIHRQGGSGTVSQDRLMNRGLDVKYSRGEGGYRLSWQRQTKTYSIQLLWQLTVIRWLTSSCHITNNKNAFIPELNSTTCCADEMYSTVEEKYFCLFFCPSWPFLNPLAILPRLCSNWALITWKQLRSLNEGLTHGRVGKSFRYYGLRPELGNMSLSCGSQQKMYKKEKVFGTCTRIIVHLF